ncbi:MAG: HAMP domain-containing protein [Lachnospiraceae bacterium]|jgi:hypothetical protein|nr:HAMP domain-containing protein [Lachnospiraceae bacterium]
MDTYWKKIKFLCILCIACSLLAAGWYAKSQGTHLLQSVRQAGETQDYWYGIDVDSGRYYLFCIRKEDQSQKIMTCPLEKDKSLIRLSDCQMDDKGNMYVACMVSNEVFARQSIAWCDFQSGKLVEMWDIDQICIEESQDYFFYQIASDQQLYLCLSSEDALFWYRLTEGGGRELVRREPMPGSVFTLLADEELNVVFIDTEGNISRTDEEGRTQLLFRNNGILFSHENVAYDFENQVIHLWNVSANRFYEIRADVADGETNVRPCKEHKPLDTLDHRKVLEDGRQVLAAEGNGFEVIDRLERGERWQARVFMKTLAILVAAGLAYIFLMAAAGRKKGGAPVWTVMVLIIIPFLAAGYGLLFGLTDRHLEQSFKNVSAVQLSRANRDFLFRMDREQFEAYRIQPYHTEERRKKMELASSGREYFRNGEKNTYTIRERPQIRQYFCKDGEIYSAESEYTMNLPIDYQFPLEKTGAMKQAVQEQRDIFLSYNDGLADWDSTFTPIIGAGGYVIGLLEASTENQWMKLEQILSGNELKRKIALASLGLLAVVLAVMWINMRPLSQLKTGILALTEGKLDARVHVAGKSEIAGIAAVFNQIGENAENQVHRTEAFQKKYEAFLPKEIFGLFGKNGIEKIRPGDEKEITASVLALGGGDSQEHSFKSFNQRLEYQLPVIKANGGIVLRLTDVGMEAIFPQRERQRALLAAVLTVQGAFKASGGEPLYAAITSGEMKIGIMGSEARCMVAVTDRQKNLAWSLLKLARECQSSILITSQAARQIPDFQEAYHFRTFGYVYLGSQKTMELIYEVLDGEAAESRRKKIFTKDTFEAGVRAFGAGDMQKARRHFIQVIANHREDKAARKYIGLCEEHMEKGQEQEALCLEKY